MPLRMTVINPSNHIVGDGPIENIIRNIIDPTNVRTPDGRGTVNKLANDNNITAHINPDKCEFNSVKKNCFDLVPVTLEIFGLKMSLYLRHCFQMDRSMR